MINPQSSTRRRAATTTPQTIDMAMTLISANLVGLLGPKRGLQEAKRVPVLAGLIWYSQMLERTNESPS